MLKLVTWNLRDKMRFSHLFSGLLLFLSAATSACAQVELSEITSKEEASVRFEYVYRKGETEIFRLAKPMFPDGPKLPNSFRALPGENFLIRSQSIVSGDSVFTLRVPAKDESEFRSLTLLMLIENSSEFEEGGQIWRDCTVARRSIAEIPDGLSEEGTKSYVEGYNERMNRFMPDFAARKLSCLFDQFREGDQYIVLAQRIKNEPKEPFTKIDVSLAGQNQDNGGETRYVLSVKNAGNVNAASVNFRSDFHSDTEVISATPKQGICRRAKYGSSFGSTVCFLGPVPSQSSVDIEFRVRDRNMSGIETPQKRSWDIVGVAKENLDDPPWNVNAFRFEPIK